MSRGQYERPVVKSYNTDGNASSFNPSFDLAYPAGIVKGDLLLLFELHRSSAVGFLAMNSDPTGGWTAGPTAYGGLGSHPHYSQGFVCGSAWYKYAVGNESGTTTHLAYRGTPQPAPLTDGAQAIIIVISKPPDSDWLGWVTFVTGVDQIAGTSWSANQSMSGGFPTLNYNDLIVAFSGINSYTGTGVPAETTYSSHRVMGNGQNFDWGTEIMSTEAEGNMDSANGAGRKMVATANYAWTSTPGPHYYTMTARNSDTNNQCGFTIMAYVKFLSWDSVLKKYKDGSWTRAQMKHYLGGTFQTLDNAYSTNRALKRYIGADTFARVSTLCLSPNTHSISLPNSGGTGSFVLTSGNHVRVLSGDTWLTFGGANQMRANGTTTIYYNFDTNPAGSPERSTTISLTLDDSGMFRTYDTITVTQAAGDVLSLSWNLPYSQTWNEVNSACSSFPNPMMIYSNTSWNIANIPSWLSIWPTSGSGNTEISSLYINESYSSDQYGYISLQHDGGNYEGMSCNWQWGAC